MIEKYLSPLRQHEVMHYSEIAHHFNPLPDIKDGDTLGDGLGDLFVYAANFANKENILRIDMHELLIL